MLYGLQRYFVRRRREMLYLPHVRDAAVSEAVVRGEAHDGLPRALSHEPAFDGDIRRLSGRCSVHSHSRKATTTTCESHARDYLASHDRPDVFEFLKWSFDDYQHQHGGARLVVVPRRRLVRSACEPKAEGYRDVILSRFSPPPRPGNVTGVTGRETCDNL